MRRSVVVLAVVAGVVSGAPAAAGCQTKACAERVQAQQLERAYQRVWVAAPATVRTHLRAIAWCESTNNERAVNGKYRGLLQFDAATWQSVGGKPGEDPAAATRWKQWALGVRLYLRRGDQPWPVCGPRTR